MSVLLCVHLKNDVFPISLPSPLYQGNTLSLTNTLTPLVNFLTACKRLECWIQKTQNYTTELVLDSQVTKQVYT